jgi:hypothetical protein
MKERELNGKQSAICFALIFLAIGLMGDGEKWSGILAGAIVLVGTLIYQIWTMYYKKD